MLDCQDTINSISASLVIVYGKRADLAIRKMCIRDRTKICGPCNDVILKNMAPWLTPAERQQYSEKKEALYREACRNDPASLHLVARCV